MAQPPPTVKDAIDAKIARLRDKKKRAQDEVQACQAQIDALKAERDALTVDDDAKLMRLQQLAVIKAED